eukprot:CAMPEP_0185826070 /NCGR_PEP_ID=MMETSP1322-20130828/31359_1 /TAXON_ID=265543 /ORGANISM="Minutocellus polymorphus, Strain RCC2270" /LENGTH=734 /DNA_ID=CAMNT_0028523795 /DNA_START=22 /DNA_END=2229 /DNA_ORIENTATION=+
MRVFVRLDNSDGSSPGGGVTKVLRIEDSSVEFFVLLQTIATKLGVQVQLEAVAQEWELYLEAPSGKKALIEDASDIVDGDTLVLRYSHTVTVKSETQDEGDDGIGNDGNAPVGSKRDDDNSSVETVPHKPPEDVEVIEISDDSDDDSASTSSSEDDDEDDDEYESNADDLSCDETEETKEPSNKSTDLSCGETEETKKSSSKPKDISCGDNPEEINNPSIESRDLSCGETEETKKPSIKSKDPPLQVHMNEQDTPSAPGVNSEDLSDSEDFSEVATLTSFGDRVKFDTDQAVKSKIIKLLNTGFHDGSNEHEAKKAMNHAQRLMQKHNLSQALLLKEREEESSRVRGVDDGEKVLKGGLVKVRIVYRKTQKPAQMARWISKLMGTVAKNFGVKSYNTDGPLDCNLMGTVAKNFGVKSYKTVRRGRKCCATFYGIYMNCQLAAYAFRVAVERISQMAAEHKPAPGSSVSTKSSRLSYALGIKRGIADAVDENIEQEKKRHERKLERARRAVASGEAYEESDDENDYDDDESDGKGNGGDGIGFSFPSTPPGSRKKLVARKSQKVAFASPMTMKVTTRRAVASGEAYEESDDEKDDDDDDDESDSKGNGGGGIGFSFPSTPPGNVSVGKGRDNEENCANEPCELAGRNDSKISGAQRLKEVEKEEQTALVLVNHQEKVAEKVLKDNGIKLHSGRKRKRIAWDHASYKKGILDSKEIDLNQRAIQDDWTKKVKKEEK